MNCVFCQIASGQIESQIIYQDDKFVAFLDNKPQSPGHILVIPREHFNSLLDVPNNLLADMIITVKRIAQATLSLGADGFNICQNNGQVAGQMIDHVHFHIIPRYLNNPQIDHENIVPTLINQLK